MDLLVRELSKERSEKARFNPFPASPMPEETVTITRKSEPYGQMIMKLPQYVDT